MRQDASSYLQHFGLHRDPFSDKGTRGLFFPGGGRKEVVDQLLHFVRYGNAPVLLTGPQGAGKTWVLQALLILLDDTVDASFIPAALMMTPGQLANQIATDFAVDVSDIQLDVNGMWSRIAERAADAKANGRQFLLCIDSAEDLSADVIESLFAALTQLGDGLRVIFAGNAQATHVLEEMAAEQQLLLHRLEMKVFSKQDVEHYLRYRLTAAGYQGDMPFTDLQVEALVHRSQGSIEQLNHAARSMLQAAAGAADVATPAGRSFPLLHAAALAVLALLIGVGIFWGGDDDTEEKASREIALELPAPANIEMLDEAALSEQLDSQSEDVADLENAASDRSGAPADNTDGELASRATALVGSPSADNSDAAPAAGSATKAAEVSIPAIQSVADKANKTASSIVAKSSQTQPAEVVKPAEAPKPQVAAKPVAAPKPAEAPKPVESKSVEAPKPAPAKEITVESLDVDPVDTRAAEQRLLGWSSSGYALQMFATHNGRRAKQFVDEHFGQADLLFYRVVQNDKPWYIVVNGPYSDRAAAKLSLLSLPSSLQRLRPWPRPISGIQKDIRSDDR